MSSSHYSLLPSQKGQHCPGPGGLGFGHRSTPQLSLLHSTGSSGHLGQHSPPVGGMGLWHLGGEHCIRLHRTPTSPGSGQVGQHSPSAGGILFRHAIAGQATVLQSTTGRMTPSVMDSTEHTTNTNFNIVPSGLKC